MDLVGACVAVLVFLVVLGTELGDLKVASFLGWLVCFQVLGLAVA